MTGWTNSETFKNLMDAMDFVENDLKFNLIFEWTFEHNVDNTITIYWNE